MANSALAGALAFLPTGVALFDLQGIIIQANPALVRLAGRKSADVIGTPITRYAEPQHKQPLSEWLGSIGATGNVPPPIRFEAWHTRPSGERVFGVVDFAYVTDHDDEVRYGLAITHDQTDMRRLADAASASQQELATLIDALPIAIYKLDAQRVSQIWNPAAEQLYGWSAAEVLGHPIDDLPDIDPPSAAHDIDLLFKSPPLKGVEISRTVRDGSIREFAAWTALTHGPAGDITSLTCAAVDITERKRADAALEAIAQRFQALIFNISDTVNVISPDGEILFSAGQEQPVLGYESSWWPGQNIFELTHPDDVDRGTDLVADLLAHPDQEVFGQFRLRHAEGHWEHIHVTGRNLIDDPNVGGLILTTRNITEQTLTDELLESQARILELIATSSAIDTTLSAIVDMVMRKSEGTRAAVFLIEHGQIVPRGNRHLPINLLASISSSYRTSKRGGMVRQACDLGNDVKVTNIENDPLADGMQKYFKAAGIQSVWMAPVFGRSERIPIGMIAVMNDLVAEPGTHEQRLVALASQLVAIAVERHEAETQLAHQAVHDTLTGLPNRALLLDRLNHSLVRARHLGQEIAVLFLDLDRFKVVNDSLGHGAGDQLLVAFTERLKSIVRPEDTVARFGGDEFVIISEQAVGATVAVAIAERLAQTMSEPFALDSGDEVFLTVSLGLSTGDGPDGEILLRNADAAMFRAKELGRNQLAVFDKEMQTAAVTRLKVGNDLRRAVEREEFVLLHQPIVDIPSGRIVGSEALIRWSHPTRGLLLPHAFIPVTEEAGLIIPIGEWVIHTALAHAQSWSQRHEMADFCQSVNLSALQLGSPSLLDTVAEALATNNWPAENLCLELTESVLLDDLDVTLEVLVKLKELGVHLAIDDFGTGYSSLTYLQRFPVDSVKIDQSFVARLTVEEPDGAATIPRAVVLMAHAMGLKAVAEGVETADQLKILGELGCDKAQGFLFSPPVSSDELSKMLEEQANSDETGQA